MKRLAQKLKAAVFVYAVRPFLSRDAERVRDCPVCGQLLELYDDYGWLHLADGDADCYGALSYGKGKKLA